MNEIPISALIGILVLLIILSAFFSSSETGLMSLNRYRLRHLRKIKHGGAIRASELLDRPERLLGLILLGNNFVNILASSIATLIAIRLWGDNMIGVAAMVLTVVILIFAEVAPKTLAALHPEAIAYPAAYIYRPLMKLLYPVVFVVNMLSNGLLRLLGVPLNQIRDTSLNREELRTLVKETGHHITKQHRDMLLNILDLEKVTVEDIMIPRNEIQGIDLDEDWDHILEQISKTPYTRMPVFHESLDKMVGIIHMRRILALLKGDQLTLKSLKQSIQEPYFIPEGTPLSLQLINFQKTRRRIGFVVDEYGDIQGMATMDDILEEIVGEFTIQPDKTAERKEVEPQADGSYLVDASAYVRELNRSLNLNLPTDGPKTLNGLITEHLETIPDVGTCISFGEHSIEIVETGKGAVQMVRICPHGTPAGHG